MTRRALLLLLLLCGGCSTAQQKPFAWAVLALVALVFVGGFVHDLFTDSDFRRAVLGVVATVLLLFVLGWAVVVVNSCQRQPAPPQDAPSGLDSLERAMDRAEEALSDLEAYMDSVNVRPDTLTRQEAPNEEVSPKEARAVGVVVRRQPARLAAAEDRSLSGAPPVTLDSWVLPSFIPHNLDTLTFRAPIRDQLPGSCAVDSSHFLTDSVWVWVERRYLNAPPWAPWMDRWHLVRRIRLAPGQPCTLNTARPAWHKFSVRDRAGNVSCADSIYSGPR